MKLKCPHLDEGGWFVEEWVEDCHDETGADTSFWNGVSVDHSRMVYALWKLIYRVEDLGWDDPQTYRAYMRKESRR